ncbi:transposase [Dyadobacter psychrotolerans]|uniref:transposase n=1 Tax=Dyadobacter psychrotolerans TaxID=2541721 RepID=UPI001C70D423|nr:transposase [Dyadobacter psychrotolerans]
MKLLQALKQNSSKWIKTKGREYSDFYWQDGYAIFSVNPYELDVVIRYITNQKAHHQNKDFKGELRSFLKKYNIEYDEQYIWD